MIVSLNWLKKYTDITMPMDELVKVIGSRLVEIEDVIDIGVRYERIVIADIVDVQEHANADKLNVYLIDDGNVADRSVPRDANGRVTVVSGDKTLEVGDKVAWLMPGATVPNSFEDAGEPFVLGSRDMRGITSHGMFGSGKELDVNADAERVMKLETDAAAGTAFAGVFELDGEYLLDIENKSLTHRPDCFGLIGLAREVAAIQGLTFESPRWYMALEPVLAPLGEVVVDTPQITIDDPHLCARFEAVVLDSVEVDRRSPQVIQSYLKRSGMRPVNAVVDVTNYLMLVTGQPLHAFDYDTFLRAQNDGDSAKIVVRTAQHGEKLTLLDSRVIELDATDIVVCAGETPVSLAGAMGGADTEVTNKTTRILLEAATFNLYNLRTTSMRHGVFSEAVTRLTKGQAAAQGAPVLASAVRMLATAANARRVSEIGDTYPVSNELTTINVPIKRIHKILDESITLDEAVEVLRRVEIGVKTTNDTVTVTPPYWRADLRIPADAIEEVGRLRGFDMTHQQLPLKSSEAVMPSSFDNFRTSVRNTLSSAGANEVLTYAFVPEKMLLQATQDPTQAFKIVNALSPDLQYYRLSLLPSLLAKVTPNIRQNEAEFALYEQNKVHRKAEADGREPELPRERQSLAFVYAANDKVRSAEAYGDAYYQAFHYLDHLLGKKIRVAYEVSRLDVKEASFMPGEYIGDLMAPFEPLRSAVISVDGVAIGAVGELKSSVTKAFKLPAYTAAFEIDMEAVHAAREKRGSMYTPISRYQGLERDITLSVAADVHYGELKRVVAESIDSSGYEWSLRPLGIYIKEDGTKNITFRVSLIDHDRSITSRQADDVLHAVAESARHTVSATKM